MNNVPDDSDVASEHPRIAATYIAGVLNRPLPDDVVARTRLHLLDTIAAIVSGSRLRAGRLAAGFVEAEGGRPEATVIGTPIRTSEGLFSGALLGNATLPSTIEEWFKALASNILECQGTRINRR